MNFKKKYHSDSYRSQYYAAQESYARSLLESIISKNRLPLEVVSLGLTETQGIVPDYYSSTSNRFDFAIVRKGDRAIVCIIEVTGDEEKDRYARILTEKIRVMERFMDIYMFYQIYVLYLKRTSIGTVKTVKWFGGAQLVDYLKGRGCPDCYVAKWTEGEKPYLFVKLSYGITTQQFVAILKKLPSEIGRLIPRITVDDLVGFYG